MLSRGIDWCRTTGACLHLIVEVRPAFRPGRWSWYAVDCDSGEVVEYAFEYESPLAARDAGVERLKELASCPLRGAIPSVLRRRTAVPGTQPNHTARRDACLLTGSEM